MRKNIKNLKKDFSEFILELYKFSFTLLHLKIAELENRKILFATALYRQRGKMAHKFVHSGMAGLTALGVVLAPVMAEEFPGRDQDPGELISPSSVLSASTTDPSIGTSISEKGFRDKIIEYVVEEGDTVSTIAQKFGVSTDTIRWQNNLASKDAIKIGQVLEILPVEGVSHKVQKGDTIYSVAKKYDTEPQGIVNFPFNSFVNDETFELAVGQVLIVPEGVKQDQVLWQPVARVKQITPDAGTVVASGSFVWPTAGTITQRFSWYHKAIDIANRAAPTILAADSGKVIVAGWPDNVGYGNRVVIDHGNGFRTLYAHLSRVYVVAGQTVTRGSSIGQMGTTGRSTGIHLHFEVIQNGVYLNPLSVLR